MEVKGWSRALPLLLLLALLPLLFFPILLPNTYALSPLIVDVWTNKGGQGQNNLDGGQYTVGEPITITCEFYGGATADRMDLLIVRPDGSWSLYPLGTNINEGTYSTTVSGPVGEWMVSCAVKFGGSTLGDVVNFTVLPPPQTLTVDVWTNKGGRGVGNLDGGQYTVGESITLYCETAGATLLRMVLIRPDGSSVEVLKLSNVQAGTYSVSGTVGEPTGVWIASCIEQHGERDPVALLWDDVRFTVQQRATATVTVYTTTTRTVTSTLHATATTETTTYTTTTRTLYTTFTRTWYTTVTTTVTTTITSWTTTTVRTMVMMSASYEVVLSLAALTPLASAYILRTRRRSRNSGGVVRG
jgi:hypothetical protein